MGWTVGQAPSSYPFLGKIQELAMHVVRLVFRDSLVTYIQGQHPVRMSSSSTWQYTDNCGHEKDLFSPFIHQQSIPTFPKRK
jgi:hypothetical protein